MEKELRIKRVTIRFTGQEWVDVEEQIYVSGLSIAEYVRRRVLGLRVVSKMDLRMIAELRKLGGLLKHIHNETRGMYSHETAEAIQALTSYARKLERAASHDS